MAEEYLTFNNGVKFPLFGYGTWLSNDEEQLRKSLRVALDSGYRHIDTAYFYNNEHVIGEILAEYFDAGKLNRSDIFVTTKLPWFMNRPEYAEIAIKKSLKDLRLDYVDLYLVHFPAALKPNKDYTGPERDESGKCVIDSVDVYDTWKVLEKYYKQGLFKAIGVSNFSAKQLQYLYDKAEIKPVNNQIEIHILFPQFELVEFCKKLGVTVTSFSTLGNPGRKTVPQPYVEGDCLAHPVTVELAKKYKKTPAQILLRHTIQRGIAVIPKSLTESRIKENIDINFTLADEDQQKLLNIGENTRLHLFAFCAHHPDHPFKDGN
ncbi:unnamed protein product [Bursaphelenchus xylophilus]|uniref:(pine wood nematode) hypothetical protein n=1 Tax=Bursaphelenchus xylophilus TaxID=6326 RepID=A0A1I7RNK0_BURXY|nr:unnamed protein product [Bursaphelenchus xylophilus]CAG9124102.1 unnamed protein product [Bursaphelenchus xylophilus]